MSTNAQNLDRILKIDLLKELHLENLPSEEKMSLIDDISQVVVKGTWLKILERLSDDDKKKLEDIISGALKPNEFITELKKLVPDVEEIIKKEVAIYKETLLPY